jgi:poly(A) polymerase
MMDRGALQIVRTLREAGYQALLAGGCVRDRLMGRTPEDWDVATDAAPEAVMELFARTVPVGVQFGIVVVLLEEGRYEVARFRRDGRYLDGRRPEKIEFADAEADARRRDFTINGLFYDPLEERLIDYVGGRRDIEGGLVRAIGDPEERFAEDYLRMLRAVRFATRFSFAIEEETFAAIRLQAPQIKRISPERVRDELTRILTEGNAARGVQLLMDSKLLREVLPEVAAMAGVPQPPEFHPEGDVWTHVVQVLENLHQPGASLAWGALLHDIGKPPTLAIKDRIRFDGHDAVGAEMAQEICRRLHMANQESQRVCQLVAQHMRVRHVKKMRPSKLKRFLREPYFAELLELHRADCLASHGQLDLYEFCRGKLAETQEEELRPPRLVTGHDLKEMGFAPGPLFREILEAVEDAQLEGQVHSREEARELVRRQFGDRIDQKQATR